MFELTREEFESLRSQNMTSNRGGRRYLPMVFTEHGAIMAASVLNSDRAVEMSVYVVRAFVQLRELLVTTRPWPTSWQRWSGVFRTTTTWGRLARCMSRTTPGAGGGVQAHPQCAGPWGGHSQAQCELGVHGGAGFDQPAFSCARGREGALGWVAQVMPCSFIWFVHET